MSEFAGFMFDEQNPPTDPKKEAATGFEPVITVLQTVALVHLATPPFP